MARKVLHLLKSSRFSGAENMVCQIIDMMKRYPEYEMVYCSPDGQIRQALEERGISFVPVKKMCYSEVRRVLREQKPDIIHAHDMGASFYAAITCGEIPLISHIHNNAFDSRRISVKSVAYMYTARKVKHIFWVSQSAYNGYCFKEQCADKSSVLYNIINVESLYRRMEEDTNTYHYDVVFVGRLTYPKNPQRLLRVLAKAVAQKPELKAAVVGSGEMDEEVKMLCAELGLEDSVSFLGFRSNPLKILYNAKVMIMTSRWEGLPMCALESLALGVPIVSTPTDGLKELLEEGKNGFLSDDDDVLADKLLLLVSDIERQKTMSACAKDRAMDINNVVEYSRRLNQVYRQSMAPEKTNECECV